MHKKQTNENTTREHYSVLKKRHLLPRYRLSFILQSYMVVQGCC